MDLESFIEGRKALIKEHGFTLIGVFDPEEVDPNFVYSIGLTERGWPELIFIGDINPVYVEVILTDLIRLWEEEGKPVLGKVDGIIVNYPLRLVEVDAAEASEKYGYQVRNFYPYQDIKFVQVLWPDKQGVFPDEPGYDNERSQPVIGR